MRLGIVCSGRFFSTNAPSAAERRIRDYARGLAVGNNEVVILAPAYHNKDGLQQEATDYRVEYLGSSNDGGFKITKKYGFQKALYQYAVNNLDALFFYNTRIDGAITAFFAKRKKVFIINEFCDAFALSQTSWLRNFIFSIDEHLVPKTSNLNIVISDLLEKTIKEKAPKTPILKIPILVDSEIFIASDLYDEEFRRENKLNDKILISYTGTFWKKYGVRTLVAAFGKLLKEFPNIHLILAGPDKFTEKHDNLPEVINSLNLAEHVTLTGWLDTDALVKVLNASDVLVMPHLDDPFCANGFPTKIGEYASVGKPIVSSDVGDLNQYFQDQRDILFYEAGNEEELKKCLIRLISSESLRKDLGTNVQKVARKYFDYESQGQKIIDRINSIR